MKITFVGAGSTVFAKNVLGDAMLCPSFHDAEIALYDIAEQRLEESYLIIEGMNKTINEGRATVKKYLGADERREALRGATEMLTNGILGARFDDIAASLLTNRFGCADPYMTLADFDSYAATQNRIGTAWGNPLSFANMALVNIAKAGIFSADRAINQYRQEIWKA